MGLKIHSIAEIPNNISRSYYLYILDYYNWDEPIGKTLRDSFDKIAEFASQNDAVVIQGIGESHFYSELLSWQSVNGIDPKDLLPALMITTIHPQYFIERDNKEVFNEQSPKDNLIFLEIGKICKTPQDVIELLKKVFKDIQDKKELKNFRVKKEMKSGVGGFLNNALILEPNIAGIGVNLNTIIKFILGK